MYVVYQVEVELRTNNVDGEFWDLRVRHLTDKPLSRCLRNEARVVSPACWRARELNLRMDNVTTLATFAVDVETIFFTCGLARESMQGTHIESRCNVTNLITSFTWSASKLTGSLLGRSCKRCQPSEVTQLTGRFEQFFLLHEKVEFLFRLGLSRQSKHYVAQTQVKDTHHSLLIVAL